MLADFFLHYTIYTPPASIFFSRAERGPNQTIGRPTKSLSISSPSPQEGNASKKKVKIADTRRGQRAEREKKKGERENRRKKKGKDRSQWSNGQLV